jgi:hypothetical protein
LSIAYFMAWTAVTAVLLAVMTQTTDSMPRASPWLTAYIALQATLSGWIYFGGLLILWHAVRRTLWRLEPGEWLTLCLANAFFLTLATQLLGRLLIHWAGSSIYAWLSTLALFQIGAMAGGYVVAAVAQRRRPLWCGVFAIIGVPPLLLMLLGWMRLLSNATPTLAAVLFVAIAVGLVLLLVGAIVGDRRRREPRHWLHWSGVVITCLILLLILGFSLYATFAF